MSATKIFSYATLVVLPLAVATAYYQGRGAGQGAFYSWIILAAYSLLLLMLAVGELAQRLSGGGSTPVGRSFAAPENYRFKEVAEAMRSYPKRRERIDAILHDVLKGLGPGSKVGAGGRVVKSLETLSIEKLRSLEELDRLLKAIEGIALDKG